MTLSRPVKIVVGILTLWYALYLLLTFIGILILFGLVFISIVQGGESVLNLRVLFTRMPGFELFLSVHICGLFLEVGLLVFYLIHTLRNTKANDALRIALGLGHLFLPFVAMPVYYYLYIWRDDPPVWAAAKGRQLDLQAGNAVG
jgi:hypothetical protein